MKIWLALFFGIISLTPWAWAQELPLWRLTNPTTAAPMPAFNGGMSPFALSEPAQEVNSATTSADDEETRVQRQNMANIERAQQLIASQSALQPELLSPVKALTQGAQGVKVLINGAWVGVGESLPIHYKINPDIRALLQDIQKFSSQEAYQLAKTVEDKQRKLESQQAKVYLIDKDNKKIVLKGPLGEIVLPLKLAE